MAIRATTARTLLAAACMFVGEASHAQWPLFHATPIELTTPIHTSAAGSRSVVISAMSETGIAAGRQIRYLAGTNTPIGSSAVVFRPGTSVGAGSTMRIGLYGSQYVDPTTSGCDNRAIDVSNNGTVGGEALALVGGVHAWAWTPAGGDVRVGLIDADHTSPSGKQYSDVLHVPIDSSVVVGTASRFAGTVATESRVDENLSAWAWTSAGGTVRLGFTSAANTNSQGRQVSQIGGVSAAGHVAGWSNMYATGSISPSGSDAWVWHPDTGLVQAGPLGAAFTNPATGRRSCRPSDVNSDGTTVGTVSVYDTSTGIFSGIAAFAWSSTGIDAQMYLTGPGTSSSTGTFSALASAIGEGGHVAGTQSLYNADGSSAGRAAWAWKPATSAVQIGLYDSQYAASTGLINQGILQVLPSNRTLGYAGDIPTAITSKRALWMYTPGPGATPGTTVEIIPPSSVQRSFVSPSGRRRVLLEGSSRSGDRIVGVATTFDGETPVGEVGFTFNPSSGNYVLINLADEQGDRLSTIPFGIRDDQSVYGGTFAGTPPATTQNRYGYFLWKAGQGSVQPGDLLLGGIASAGFSSQPTIANIENNQSLDHCLFATDEPDPASGGSLFKYALAELITCEDTSFPITLKALYQAARQPQMTLPQGADQALVHRTGSPVTQPMRGVRLGGAGSPITNPVVWGNHLVSTGVPAVGPIVAAGVATTLQDRSPSLDGVFVQPGAGMNEASVSVYTPGAPLTLLGVTLRAEVLGDASDGVRISLSRIDSANATTTLVPLQTVLYSASGSTLLAPSAGAFPVAIAATDRIVLTVDRGAGTSNTEDWAVVDLTLTVGGSPVITTQPVMEPQSCLGRDVSVTVAALGGSGYRWQKNGQPLDDGPTGHPGGSRLSGVNTPTLTIRSAALLDAGTYACVVSNGCGATISGTTTITPTVCACGRADLGQQGGIAGPDGLLDNNDFVVFISLFFLQAPTADFGQQGGLPFPDGQFDNNDFIVFIDAFFGGCGD